MKNIYPLVLSSKIYSEKNSINEHYFQTHRLCLHIARKNQQKVTRNLIPKNPDKIHFSQEEVVDK